MYTIINVCVYCYLFTNHIFMYAIVKNYIIGITNESDLIYLKILKY